MELNYLIDRIKDQDEIMPIFDQLTLSCKYRSIIREQLNNNNILWEELDELLEKYKLLKSGIVKIAKIVYKFVKGDDIDKLFGDALMRRGCTVSTKRVSVGIYMFGTRQIIAKIVNGRLMIRVGGGFMTIDEFITQYGPIEMIKYQTALDVERGGKKPNSRASSSPSKNMQRDVAKMRKTIAIGLNAAADGGHMNSQD
jgi:hypothetical protein